MSRPTNLVPSIFGGILLVISNIIGAGILALPLVTAQLGLPCAVLTLFFVWLLLLLGAHYYLEANFALPSGANLISMSRAAFGKWGVVIAWACNLLVMYSLISAYISGGGDLIQTNVEYLGISLPSWASSIIFLMIFSFIATRGIRLTDLINRPLVILKMGLFFIVLSGLGVKFNAGIISTTVQTGLSASLLIVIITSFGFATIIPSLRNYYKSDVVKIKKIIFWGSFISLLCYIFWIAFVFSILPYHGEYGLAHIAASIHPVSDLQRALSQSLQITWIVQATNIFSSLCIVTSFLANSISLTDFIADGLHLSNSDKKSWLVYLIAFLPPMCMVLFYPEAFLLGLSIAGAIAIIQLLILPAAIVWVFRYSKIRQHSSYAVAGDKVLLVLFLSASCLPLLLSIIHYSSYYGIIIL